MILDDLEIFSISAVQNLNLYRYDCPDEVNILASTQRLTLQLARVIGFRASSQRTPVNYSIHIPK